MTIDAKAPLAPGLHVVAVPIGNARDITLRALDVLAAADVLVAEDTRSLKRLLTLHGLSVGGRPLHAYHEHNGPRMRPVLLAALAAGQTVALMSEAGTPTISDPGFDLVRAVREAGYPVTAAPGVSALVTALSVAGLPTDRVLFAGFLPSAAGPRRNALAGLAEVRATLALYESPRRLAAMLADAAAVLGPDRDAAVCRELTKTYEEVRDGSLASLAEHYAAQAARGEVVVLIAKGVAADVSEMEIESALETALTSMSVRDAADAVAGALGVRRKAVYSIAVRLAAKQ